jgi:hypothetical protein
LEDVPAVFLHENQNTLVISGQGSSYGNAFRFISMDNGRITEIEDDKELEQNEQSSSMHKPMLNTSTIMSQSVSAPIQNIPQNIQNISVHNPNISTVIPGSIPPNTSMQILPTQTPMPIQSIQNTQPLNSDMPWMQEKSGMWFEKGYEYESNKRRRQ